MASEYTPCNIALLNISDTYSANISGHKWIILVRVESWPGAFMCFIFLFSQSTSSLQVGAKQNDSLVLGGKYYITEMGIHCIWYFLLISNPFARVHKSVNLRTGGSFSGVYNGIKSFPEIKDRILIIFK